MTVWNLFLELLIIMVTQSRFCKKRVWNCVDLPATGSEMNSAVVTIEATKKNWHSVVLLCFQILYMWPNSNSVFTKRQLQNGVVDAYTHVMEQYLTYPHEGYLQDRIAEGIPNLNEIGPKVVENPRLPHLTLCGAVPWH
jgi:alcohol dehydrogenase YqhD (iron-dependent ADH family)